MDADNAKTCLSAGEIVRAVLMGDPAVSERVKNVYPIVADASELPYIVYRRTGYEQTAVKSPKGGDTVHIEVLCLAASYLESVEIAEAVRAALDGMQAEYEGLTIRGCTLEDSSEDWEADAYIQQLVFRCRM